LQGCSSGRSRRVRRQCGCHLYFARRVTFLSCVDTTEPRDLQCLR
jgi:hypothetical protein